MMSEYFAVFDAVAERYVDAFPALNVGVAIRGFEEACGNPETDLAKHPEDYSLWKVGAFDNANGIMTGVTPVKLAMASSFIGSGPLAVEN